MSCSSISSEKETNSGEGSEYSATDADSGSESDPTEFNDNVVAYQHEPLADIDENDADQNLNEDNDEDGLTLNDLEARFTGAIPLSVWCKCGHCNTDYLVSAREYRCCSEMVQASGKLVFEGLSDHVCCIVVYPDYEPMTNRTVLEQVGPLLKDRNGKYYKRPALGQSSNKFGRAVAYRWLIRWLCGYLGWQREDLFVPASTTTLGWTMGVNS